MVDAPSFRKPDRYKASSYRAYNDRMPSRYDTSPWLGFCQVARWDRALVRELGPDVASLRILDVGCATGRLLLRLAEAGARQLFGADLAPRILEVAREKLAETDAVVELRTADAEDVLPWDPESFDVVTLTGVLHHFFRPGDALAEIRRVLRPGGRILVADPCFFTPLRQVLNLALRVAPHDGDFRFHSAQRAAMMLADLGYEVGRTRRVGLWAFLVRGRKPSRCGSRPDHANGDAASGRPTRPAGLCRGSEHGFGHRHPERRSRPVLLPGPRRAGRSHEATFRISRLAQASAATVDPGGPGTVY